MSANGQLSKSELAPITKCANGEQGYLRKDAAAAFLSMNAESEKKYGVTLRATSARTAYRSLSDQRYFWDIYISGRGNLAARPGTSNHGLGLAVDFATPRMRQIVDAIGTKYGWAKKWSDAPTEWWHIKWKAGNYNSVSEHSDSGFHGFYSDDELRWMKEYDHLVSSNSDQSRREVLRSVMTEQRKKIWRAAQDSGWSKLNRTKRYASLLARTK